jgi:SAM-dependent methyltransferase
MVPWIQQYLAVGFQINARGLIRRSERIYSASYISTIPRGETRSQEKKSNCDRLRAQVPEVDYHEGDLENLPFPDQSFDAVMCALALTHLETLDRAIAEMTRVVRPGGFVYFPTFIRCPGS